MNPTTDVQDRTRFLQILEELSGGEPGRNVSLEEIAQRLDLPRDQAVLIAESLCSGLPGSAHHRLLQPAREDDYSEIGITQEGLEFLEEAEATTG